MKSPLVVIRPAQVDIPPSGLGALGRTKVVVKLRIQVELSGMFQMSKPPVNTDGDAPAMEERQARRGRTVRVEGIL